MSTENQPTEVEKPRLQPGGDIADANAAVKLMTTTGVPEIANTFEEAGANYVTISILGGRIANAYQLVPATAEEQSAKWPTRDGYENRFVTWGGQLHRLQGPPRRFKAAEGAPPDGSPGARGAAEPAAPESEEETAHPAAPPPGAIAGRVEDTGAPGEPDEGARAEGEDEEAEDGEDEPLDAGDEKGTDSTGGAKTEAPAAGAAAAPKAAEAKKEEPPRSYEWEETPVRLILHLRPNDGHELGREIWITGVTYDGDVPKAAVIREKELGELPPPVAAVVQNLKGSLPELREAHEAGLRAESEKKRAEEERKLKEKIKNKHKAGAKAGAASAGARSKPAATPAPPASQAVPAAASAQDQSSSAQEAAPAREPAAGASDEAILNDDRPVIDATGDEKPEPQPAPTAATATPAKPRPQPRKPAPPPAESTQGSLW